MMYEFHWICGHDFCYELCYGDDLRHTLPKTYELRNPGEYPPDILVLDPQMAAKIFKEIKRYIADAIANIEEKYGYRPVVMTVPKYLYRFFHVMTVVERPKSMDGILGIKVALDCGVDEKIRLYMAYKTADLMAWSD